jgi:hypothetical protein
VGAPGVEEAHAALIILEGYEAFAKYGDACGRAVEGGYFFCQHDW